MTTPAVTVASASAALQEVLDPCSVGRGVPAGLVDMGMIKDVSVTSGCGGATVVSVELRITSPSCTFQPYFERAVRDRLGALPGVDEVRIDWNRDFDWSDDDLSPDVKRRLAEKRQRFLAMAAPPGR